MDNVPTWMLVTILTLGLILTFLLIPVAYGHPDAEYKAGYTDGYVDGMADGADID